MRAVRGPQLSSWISPRRERPLKEEGQKENARRENRERGAVLFFPNQQAALEEPLTPGGAPRAYALQPLPEAWPTFTPIARGPGGRPRSGRAGHKVAGSGPSSCGLGWPPAASRSNEHFAEHRRLFRRRLGRGRPENPIPSPAALAALRCSFYSWSAAQPAPPPSLYRASWTLLQPREEEPRATSGLP